MYVIIQTEANLWTVGFYNIDNEWNPHSDHDSIEDAEKKCHYLNGGK